jgi:hypothetical protein
MREYSGIKAWAEWGKSVSRVEHEVKVYSGLLVKVKCEWSGIWGKGESRWQSTVS